MNVREAIVAAMIVTVTEAGSCCCLGADTAHENDVISPVQGLGSVFGGMGRLWEVAARCLLRGIDPSSQGKTALANSLRRDVAVMLAMLSISVKAGHQPFGEGVQVSELDVFPMTPPELLEIGCSEGLSSNRAALM